MQTSTFSPDDISTTDALARPTITTRVIQALALGAVMLLALVLHFFRLDQEGYANLYYAATVKSMLTSWHNFLDRKSVV